MPFFGFHKKIVILQSLAVVRVGYPDESPEPKNKFKEENISYNKFGGKKQ